MGTYAQNIRNLDDLLVDFDRAVLNGYSPETKKNLSQHPVYSEALDVKSSADKSLYQQLLSMYDSIPEEIML